MLRTLDKFSSHRLRIWILTRELLLAIQIFKSYIIFKLIVSDSLVFHSRSETFSIAYQIKPVTDAHVRVFVRWYIRTQPSSSSKSTQHVCMRMHTHVHVLRPESQVALHGSATAEIRYMRLASAFSASAIWDEEKGRGTRSEGRKHRKRNGVRGYIAQVDPHSK